MGRIRDENEALGGAVPDDLETAKGVGTSLLRGAGRLAVPAEEAFVNEEDVEALLEVADRLYPDPVDVFEDSLAAELGLYRGPGMSKGQWRKLRVEVIESGYEVSEG